MNFFHYYLIIINIIAFITYGIDKQKAKRNLWRIPEAQLLLLAIIGGSIGAYLGMHIWHHKTKHVKFRLGIPVIITFQLLLLFFSSHVTGSMIR